MITAETLFEKLMRLPRLARIRFLCVWTERVSFLVTALCPKLIVTTLADKAPYQKRLWDDIELIEKYVWNPYSVDRASLETAKDEASDIADRVSLECKKDGASVALAVSSLAECAIGVNLNAFEECFRLVYRIILMNCSRAGRDLVHRSLDHELDLLLEDKEKYNWTDDTPPKGQLIMAAWPLGKPDGWPNEGLPFAGMVLTSFASKGAFGWVTKLFK